MQGLVIRKPGRRNAPDHRERRWVAAGRHERQEEIVPAGLVVVQAPGVERLEHGLVDLSEGLVDP